ncbi:acyl-CoA thioesterase/BAAT N-terminal domain-containing protein [uncultured Friedmanniella sp.]|uniref:acyl-CoA thioesterase/BAAT N-terminal domain-containing protein n=1 Tax=uncultured Friedmanniella sp. TaxID=335381 RepID=UPI0035CB58C2
MLPTKRLVVVAAVVPAILALPLAGCSHPSRADRQPQLIIEPTATDLDRPVTIRVAGLAPAEIATLQLTSTDGTGTVWASHADYVADQHGTVDVTTAAATNGTYSGTDPMGLVTSMQPTTTPAGYRWPRTPSPFTATVTAAGKTATSAFTRTLVHPGTTIEYIQPTVAAKGFSGLYATRTAEKKTRHPAVLLIGGSEGGNDEQVTAAAFTLHGMSALSIAYFGAPGLPKTLSKIPLEYFANALTWLRSQPGVDPDRVWVAGTSRGSEAAQLLAVYYPGLVHGVIAGSPSNVINCSYPTGQKPCDGAAWTYHGKPLPYSSDFNNPTPSDNPEAVIPVERIHGPMIIVCGGADQVWRSCLLSRAILSRRKTHHTTYTDHLYSYTDAGHGIGNLLPDSIATPLPELEGNTQTANDQPLQNLWTKITGVLGSS